MKKYFMFVFIVMLFLSFNSFDLKVDNDNIKDIDDNEIIKDRIAALQLSSVDLKSLSTKALLQKCLDFPFNIDYILYGGDMFGFEKMTKEFNGYNELFQRKDLVPILLDELSHLAQKIDNVIKTNEGKRGSLSFRYAIMEFLSSQDIVINEMSRSQKEKINSIISFNESIMREYPTTFGAMHNIPLNTLLSKISNTNQETSDSSLLRSPVGYYQATTVYTPANHPITAYIYIGTDYSDDEIDEINSSVLSNYPSVGILGDPTVKYNCHGYAWPMSQGSDEVWVDGGTNYANLLAYWTDSSFYSTNLANATNILYSGDHSALKSSGGYYISKWGSGPLVKHKPYIVPSIYGSSNAFYRRFILSGPGAFCTNAIYSLQGLKSGDTLTWNVMGDMSISSGQNSSTISVTKTGNGFGYVYANISRNGHNLISPSIVHIAVGNPSLALMSYPVDANGNNGSWTANSLYNTYVVEEDANKAYNYYQASLFKVVNNDEIRVWQDNYLDNGFYIPYSMSEGWYLFRIKGHGDCGSSAWYDQYIQVLQGLDMSCQLSLNYNKSQEIVIIRFVGDEDFHSLRNLNSSFERNMLIIQLWDNNKLIKSFETNNDEYAISLSGLKAGVYFVRVIKDGRTYGKKFVIK